MNTNAAEAVSTDEPAPRGLDDILGACDVENLTAQEIRSLVVEAWSVGLVEYEQETDRAEDPVLLDTVLERPAGHLVEVIVDQLKIQKRPWDALGPADQKWALERARAAVVSALRMVINGVAAQSHPTLVAGVEQVTFKGGEVKAVLKALNTEGAHELANASNSEVVVVVCDVREYSGGLEDLQPVDPQVEIPMDEPQDAGETAAEEGGETGEAA